MYFNRTRWEHYSTTTYKWQNHLHFPPFCSKSHEETMVCHWLIDSNSSALSSQHPQTLRFFPREAKNIKHDRYFPQGLERLNPHENYPHTRATCWANRLARRLAQQVALVCGGLKIVRYIIYLPCFKVFDTAHSCPLGILIGGSGCVSVSGNGGSACVTTCEEMPGKNGFLTCSWTPWYIFLFSTASCALCLGHARWSGDKGLPERSECLVVSEPRRLREKLSRAWAGATRKYIVTRFFWQWRPPLATGRTGQTRATQLFDAFLILFPRHFSELGRVYHLLVKARLPAFYRSAKIIRN
jgi:hypothetical protein